MVKLACRESNGGEQRIMVAVADGNCEPEDWDLYMESSKYHV
jgi:hypothetical protein